MVALMRVRQVGAIRGGAVLAAALWWRRNPSACPYNQRFWVQAPHPLITRERLRQALAPAPGERVLEIGPGTGYYALEMAEWLAPDGTLDVLDVQQEMLDHTLRRARERGIANVTATRGDARSLPYAAPPSTPPTSSRCSARSPIRTPRCASSRAC